MLFSAVFLIVLFLSLSSSVVAFINLFRDITLLPHNPVVEEGTDVILNCTIEPQYNGSFSYKDITFVLNANDLIDASHVQFVAPRSALLTMQDVTLADSGHIWCCLPDRPVRSGLFATQDLQVFRRPLTPVVSGCIINNWESMTCSWTPTVEQQLNHTLTRSLLYHLKWKRQSAPSIWAECPHYSTEESCEWLFQDVQETTDEELVDEETYCVQVFTEEALKVEAISTEYCFQPQRIVMLSGVSVGVASVNASHGSVAWSYSPVNTEHNYTTLVYDVTVVSPWQPEMRFEIVNSLSATFHVIPFTNYTVSVKVKPFLSTFWSTSSMTTLQSLPAAPLSGPAISSSTFRTVQAGHNLRRIMLYWKSLSLRDRHGPDFHYVVMQRNEVTRTWFRHGIVVPGNQSSTVVVVDNAVARVSLLSCNAVGCSNASTVVRFPDSLSPAINHISSLLIVEGDKHRVFLSWQVKGYSNEKRHVQYTIVWCRSHPVFGLCDGGVDWVDVSPGAATDQWNLTVGDDYRAFLFGLAVSIAVVDDEPDSTGVQWTKAVFSYDGSANPPSNVKAEVPSNGKEDELSVMWARPSSSVDQGHIKAYSVFYCELNDTRQCIGDPVSVLVPGDVESSVLSALKPKTTYRIWIHSVTRTGLSARGSASVSAETTESMLTVAVILGAVVSLMLVVICSTIFFVAVFRYCRRLQSKFTSGINIRVPTSSAPPNGQGLMLNNRNSPEYSRIFYSRSGSRLSSSSRDSGHFGVSFSPSMSPQNGGLLTSPLIPHVSKPNDANHSISPARVNYTDLPVTREDQTSNENCCSNPSVLGSFRVVSPVTEPAAKGYVNTDIQAIQNPPPESHRQLNTVPQHPSNSADSDCLKTAPVRDIKAVDPDCAATVMMIPITSLAPAETAPCSAAVVGLATQQSNCDSGYVQHDEWLSKVLGIGT